MSFNKVWKSRQVGLSTGCPAVKLGLWGGGNAKSIEAPVAGQNGDRGSRAAIFLRKIDRPRKPFYKVSMRGNCHDTAGLS